MYVYVYVCIYMYIHVHVVSGCAHATNKHTTEILFQNQIVQNAIGFSTSKQCRVRLYHYRRPVSGGGMIIIQTFSPFHFRQLACTYIHIHCSLDNSVRTHERHQILDHARTDNANGNFLLIPHTHTHARTHAHAHTHTHTLHMQTWATANHINLQRKPYYIIHMHLESLTTQRTHHHMCMIMICIMVSRRYKMIYV